MASYRRKFDVYSVSYYGDDSRYSSPYSSPPAPSLPSLTFPPPFPCPPPLPSLPQVTPVPIKIKHGHKSGLLHDHALLALTICASIFVFSVVCALVIRFFYRRSRRRRNLASLIGAPLFPSDPAPDPSPDPGPDPDNEPIHHVWYIRTVGLDEATIESIAVTQYQAGSALLGSADCSVCLGDFQDGDLVRLLPKCGHAFHVPCIDTWLRAHVNCPVCRSDVVDPAVTAAAVDSTSATSEVSAGDTAETGSEARESGEVSLDEESRDGQENEHEQEVFVEIPLSDSSSDLPDTTVQTESDETELSPHPVRHRSASVDSPFMIPNVIITIPQINISHQVLKEETIFPEEQSAKEKEKPGNGSKAGSAQIGQIEIVRSLSSNSGSGRAFFFSRSGRSRSSVLPL